MVVEKIRIVAEVSGEVRKKSRWNRQGLFYECVYESFRCFELQYGNDGAKA
jgi:hypothetical protein